MRIGEKIRQARNEKEMSQEKLADKLGISMQAVSKWECGLSYPDITLLTIIADTLQVSLDYLMRDEECSSDARRMELPNDDVLRIVQCIGNKVVSKVGWKADDRREKIPLYIDNEFFLDRKVKISIWGSAEIAGNVNGDVTVRRNLTCENVNGNVTALGDVMCAKVNGNVTAGDGVNCGKIIGSVNAGEVVNGVMREEDEEED